MVAKNTLRFYCVICPREEQNQFLTVSYCVVDDRNDDHDGDHRRLRKNETVPRNRDRRNRNEQARPAGERVFACD